MEHINWYPGHMKKTKSLILENLKMVDVVIELLDARLPISSKNPIIDELVKNKKRIVLLNKSDLADEQVTNCWIKTLKEEQNVSAIPMNANSGDGIKDLYTLLNDYQKQINEKKSRNRPLRIMIVGIPNVGKSSLLNRLAGKKSAKTGNKPGVTKGKQWINLKNSIQLLDTPGILWPRFEDKTIGIKLAFVGSIKDEILDITEVCLELIEYLKQHYPKAIKERYKIDILKDSSLEIIEDICIKRGFVLSGGRKDYERAARTIMDEYRRGKLGRISLEAPE